MATSHQVTHQKPNGTAGKTRTQPQQVDLSMPVYIYANGVSQGNPGPGGWGCVFHKGTSYMELSGRAPRTTSNQAELLSVIKGLEHLSVPFVVTVFTDSSYVQQGVTTWMPAWKGRDWTRVDGGPVEFVALWKRLGEQLYRHSVAWHWGRGFGYFPGNRRATALAEGAML
jgi:ribonuclease HI